ncbi:MAG: UDP-3-O-(3-hydroxymyristoyl)glucosamine N-acyltransferase [Gammaproteobacteria bacterium]|nr:MAG: UDP-3-O-(3-hydroxymyristoyl)glucosamine N-acyltransferase [Gammaproteobacteria bacterium]
MPELTLGAVAQAIGAECAGDAACVITGIHTLQQAGPSEIAFLANGAYRRHLKETRAAAVILAAGFADECPVPCLVVANPYLAYARLSQLFSTMPVAKAGIHPSAVIAPTARVAATAAIGPRCVIGEHAVIGERTVLQPGVVIGDRSRVGAGCLLHANVTLYHDVQLGDRVTVHGSAVIGSDGFGFASSPEGWVKIAQNGGVRIGSDVEIGAGTTIDRGALDDTVLEDGVIVDNQVQIAHNVRIGQGTAIAGCTAIAGSTRIGKGCTIAGGVGITGHLTIADNVHITAMSLISKSIDEPGAYSSGTAMAPTQEWRKNAVRFLQLDQLFRRVSALEKK